MLQSRVGLDPRHPRDRRIPLALDPARPLQTAPQLDAVRHVSGSAHCFITPLPRSIVPLTCGWPGGIQCSPTPSPINHNAKSGGSPLFRPQGCPLSTWICAGNPHRRNTLRNSIRAWLGVTDCHCAGGGKLVGEHAASEHVGDRQPTDLDSTSQSCLLDRVYLPELMRGRSLPRQRPGTLGTTWTVDAGAPESSLENS